MLSIGVPFDLCGQMNFRKLKPFEKAYEKSEKQKDYDRWSQGAYFYAAISTVVANVFKKSYEQPIEYLEAPFHVLQHKQDIESGKIEMTEEERAERIKAAFEEINKEFEMAAMSRKTAE